MLSMSSRGANALSIPHYNLCLARPVLNSPASPRRVQEGSMKGGRAILSDARAQGARPCENPPPTAIVSPVIQPEAGEARNTATEAMSFGCPKRPSGVRDTICFSKSLPTMPKSCAPSVSTPPGLMAYADLLRPELLCQHARRGIERAFAGRVDDRGGHRGLARDRADIDDAAAVG